MDEEEERELDTELSEADDYTEEGQDGLICANITLQYNVQTLKAKIMKRSIGTDERPIGKYNHNHILDSRKYQVELTDRVVYEYHHNILLYSLQSQVDKEGR